MKKLINACADAIRVVVATVEKKLVALKERYVAEVMALAGILIGEKLVTRRRYDAMLNGQVKRDEAFEKIIEEWKSDSRYWQKAYMDLHRWHAAQCRRAGEELARVNQALVDADDTIRDKEHEIDTLRADLKLHKTTEKAVEIITNDLNRLKTCNVIVDAAHLDPRADEVPAKKHEDYCPEHNNRTVAEMVIDAFNRKVDDAKDIVRHIAGWDHVLRGIESEVEKGTFARFGRVDAKAPTSIASAAGRHNPAFRMLAAVMARSGKYADQTAREVLGEKEAKAWESMTSYQKGFVNRAVAKAVEAARTAQK